MTMIIAVSVHSCMNAESAAAKIRMSDLNPWT
jgi:hypothetical protein